jgi:superfamily II DNA or RNA helicase
MKFSFKVIILSIITPMAIYLRQCNTLKSVIDESKRKLKKSTPEETIQYIQEEYEYTREFIEKVVFKYSRKTIELFKKYIKNKKDVYTPDEMYDMVCFKGHPDEQMIFDFIFCKKYFIEDDENIPLSKMVQLSDNGQEIAEDDNKEDDKMNDKIDDKEDEIIKLRDNQIEAIRKTMTLDFPSGVHCQATGAGKSIIFLKLIHEYTKKNPTKNVLLFTERVDIFQKLFYYTEGEVNTKNFQKWKRSNIIDMDNYKLVEFVFKGSKKKDWFDVLNKQYDKPLLVVINRAFLTTKIENTRKYTKIRNPLSYIILDECHSATSVENYKFLKYAKENWSSIIQGFSATPVRKGKTANKNNFARLVDIFHKPGERELNLLSFFPLKEAIEKGIIVEPEFHWNYQTSNKIEAKTALKTLDNILGTRPYKKIIVWCRTITECNRWYKIINTQKSIYQNLKQLVVYIDHSKKKNDDYDQFYHKKTDCILICASKHREGSDIPNLDTCMFLDGVKNRQDLSFIQYIGRVLRRDVENRKQHGAIIDTCIREVDISKCKSVVDKVIKYYFELYDLTGLSGRNKVNDYYKVMENIIIVPDDSCFLLKLKNNKSIKINIDMNNSIWTQCISYKSTSIKSEIGFDRHDELKIIFNDFLIKKYRFHERNINYIEEYKIISHQDKNLPVWYSFYEQFCDVFSKYSWYDLLGITNLFYKDKKECLDALTNHKNIDMKKMCKIYYYKHCIPLLKKLPYLPRDLYRNDFSNIDIEFGNKKKTKKSKTTINKVKGCRDMRLCFVDGQKIRHTIETDVWEASYNKMKNKVVHNDKMYSLNGFTSTHYKIVRPNRTFSNNAWKECMYIVNDTWISTHCVPALK